MVDIVTRTGNRVIQTASNLIDVTLRRRPRTRPSQRWRPAPDHRRPPQRAARKTSRAVAITTTVDERRTLLGVVADSQEFFRRHLGASWVPGYLADRGCTGTRRVASGTPPPAGPA